MSPDDAYDQLSRALEMRAPQCNGDPRFTADRISTATAKELSEICATCDVALLCRQYAKAAKPKVGFWAGRRYSPTHAPSNTGRREAIRPARAERPHKAATTEKRITWCRAHAARLRNGVAAGDLEPWFLDVAAQREAEADQLERESKAVAVA